MQIAYLGEIFAFVTAIVWASAVILFKKSGETVHPVALNFFKNLLAMVLLLPTIYFFEGWIFKGFTGDEIALLLVSGALGIGIADTFFFKSLNLLGAGLSAILFQKPESSGRGAVGDSGLSLQSLDNIPCLYMDRGKTRYGSTNRSRYDHFSCVDDLQGGQKR